MTQIVKNYLLKRLALAAMASTTLTPTIVFASAIDPNLYADRYCALRRLGISREEATRQAVKYSLDFTKPNPPAVTHYGIQTTQDTVDAALASMKLCPEV